MLILYPQINTIIQCIELDVGNKNKTKPIVVDNEIPLFIIVIDT